MDITIPQDTPRKQCSTCKEWKPATTDFFSRMKSGRYGLGGLCKSCRSAKWKAINPNAKPRRIEGYRVPDGYKRCPKCEKELPATSEFFQKHSNGGFQPRCKQCRSEDHKIYHETHVDHIRAYEKEYRRLNHDRILARRRKNRDHINARKRLRYQTIVEVREYRQRQNRESNARHSEHKKQAFHKYYLSHRAYYLLKDRERRARELNAPGTHTHQQIKEQYARQKGICYYCRQKITWGGHHVEHVVPLTRGGSNDISNLVISCPACNHRKSNKLPHEWPEGGRLL